jgi:hypothetical protein
LTQLQDGRALGYLTRTTGSGHDVPEPVFDLQLALVDDPAAPHDLVGTLENWHQYLTG